MKNIIALMVLIVTCNSYALTEKEIQQAIYNNSVLLELYYDETENCKIKMKVYDVKEGITSKDCQNMLATLKEIQSRGLIDVFDDENMFLTVKKNKDLIPIADNYFKGTKNIEYIVYKIKK